MYAQHTSTNRRTSMLTYLSLRSPPVSPQLLPVSVSHKPKHKTGMTSLMLACQMKNEAAAAELIEATRNAGALDLQVTEETWLGVCGVRGAGR